MKKLRGCLDKKADKNTNKVAMDFETIDEDNEALTPHLTRDSTKKKGGMILEKKYGPLTPLDYLRLFTKENKYIRYHNISWFKNQHSVNPIPRSQNGVSFHPCIRLQV